MITENLSTLKIHKLTQAQYDRELTNGNIDEAALYLTPDEEIDLSPYATVEQLNEQLNTKANTSHKHDIDEINSLQSELDSKATTFTKQVALDGATSIAGVWQVGINKWTVSDILDTDNPMVGIVYSGDDETDEGYDNAMIKIRWIRTGNEYIEVYATGEIDIAIPIQLKVVR